MWSFGSPVLVGSSTSVIIHLLACIHNGSLTHVDSAGNAKMVDVGNKTSTQRVARARAVVHVGEEVGRLICENNLKKGNVLLVAQLAGIVAAKRTAELIPLCHNVPLTLVCVDAQMHKDKSAVMITSEARCEGKTGVEMEALTAVTVAALTVYDMCKAVSHDIVISDVCLLSKSGGRSGTFHRKE
ncbi:hypothetical protein PR048_014385 [Dryococelus australis]|uniref:cyclic pyranopterin monophosphate synthase n=1 Tax=Dryococelus australis TaxID=614101 RepID=A0ABQ9HE82_9NEOP|nr:hypothetical protein PR048_014385 [Dryococelus australis]